MLEVDLEMLEPSAGNQPESLPVDTTKPRPGIIETKYLPPSIPVICGYSKKEFFKFELVLLKFKAFYFFWGAAIGAVFPYVSVYLKQLGLGPNQIGIITGSRPLVGFVSGPVWGSLADHFRVHRVLLLVSTIGWLAFIMSIGFVPAAKYSNDTCPYVQRFLGNWNESDKPLSDTSAIAKDFAYQHKLRPDVTPQENLLESRGWMFDVGDLHRVYLTIIMLTILGELVQSPTGALADSGCISHLGEKEFDKYGFQRAWGSLGLGLVAMVSGLIINTTRVDTTACDVAYVRSDYRVAFYFFAACMSAGVITAYFFKYQKQQDDHMRSKPKPNPLKVFRMFMTWHYGSWLFCILFTGICNGVILGFVFWHIENIGGTQSLMGAASVVWQVSEVATFLVVFPILKRTGYLFFMILGLLGYTVRFVIFAAMKTPWLILPTEILQGFTFAGIWSVYIKYLCSSVPVEYLGTLQGFLHGVYWGLGSGSGHMFGGILIEAYGARVTFWIFAVASFVNLLIFLTIQKFSKKPNVFGNYEELGS